MTERSNSKSNYSRRDALRLMAIGGAAGLFAPNLLGKPAFAQNPPATPNRPRHRRVLAGTHRLQSTDAAYRV